VAYPPAPLRLARDAAFLEKRPRYCGEASYREEAGSADGGDGGAEEGAGREPGSGEKGLAAGRGGRAESVLPGRQRRIARGRRREVLGGLADLVEGPRAGDCAFGFPLVCSRGGKERNRREKTAIVVASADGATSAVDVNWGEPLYL